MPLFLTPITPEKLDPDALKVVHRLQRHGHEAYLVGGCVRDLLLDHKPKDFDVATSANPAEIKKLFRNCRIIGRRFRLAHIFFGAKIIETSTFRAQPAPDPEGNQDELLILRDNEFGTAEEDAIRRDFTINGLFYDPEKNKVIDHVGGLPDLEAQRLRTIGDPYIRFQEDPVRIIRAIKFSARLGLKIDEETYAAMVKYRGLIAKCSVARVLEEIYRLLGSGAAVPAFQIMKHSGVLEALFPELQILLGVPTAVIDHTPILPIGYKGIIQEHENPAPANSEDLQAREKEAAQELALAITLNQQMKEMVSRLLNQNDSPLIHTQAISWTWGHLQELDRLVRHSPEPPSHHMLLANALLGLCMHGIASPIPYPEAHRLIDEVVSCVTMRLHTSRKDRAMLGQLIIALRRMLHIGRRRLPASLTRKNYFSEALGLLEMHLSVDPGNQQLLQTWRRLSAGGMSSSTNQHASTPAPKNRRRRRRGGRRHRRPTFPPPLTPST